jgi:alpha-beta hydrolase superfamily lysophospholipase
MVAEIRREMICHRVAHDGETFVLRGWAAAAPTRTAIVVQHGLGEHGGRYATYARHLGEVPAHLWAFDARGHGETTGKRGDAAGLGALAADLEALLPAVIERAEADRVLLVGHSMGGAVVGRYLTSRTPHPAITAVCLSSPLVRVPQGAAVRLKTLAGRGLSRIAPTLTLPNGIDPRGISSDPHEVERYRTDPLVHDRLSIRLGLSLLDDPPGIVARAGAIGLPALLWHGLDDPIVDVRGTRELYEALGSSDKEMLELPGYRHESHHERPELAARLFERLRAWLAPRTG